MWLSLSGSVWSSLKWIMKPLSRPRRRIYLLSCSNEMLNKVLPLEMVLKKELSYDDFWYQQGWWACCPLRGAGSCPVPEPGDQENRALCSHGWLCYLPVTLQGNASPHPYTPHPPTHCLGLMPKEELKAWEPTFYWRSQNKHKFYEYLEVTEFAGSRDWEDQDTNLQMGWPMLPDQIGMGKGGVGRENVDSGLPWSLGPGCQNHTFSHPRGTREFCSFHWTMERMMGGLS